MWNWGKGEIPGKSEEMRGDGKLDSRGQLWESPRPREELGDRINVSGSLDFQAVRSSVSGFHSGCLGVLRLERGKDGPESMGIWESGESWAQSGWWLPG